METKKKILIVADGLLYSENIELFLSFEDFAVVCAFNGMKALEACEMDSIDLVLMDENLPGMNGFITAELIHQINESLPIICISGDDIPKQYRTHFVAHHKKPFMFDALLSTIRKTI